MARRLILSVAFALAAAAAAAHPHMWIDGVFALELDDDGVAAVRVTWLFDEFNSADLIFSYDDDLDGEISGTENARIRREAFEHLVDIDYFVLAFAGGRRLDVPAATSFDATIDEGRLRYEFTVPIRIAWREMRDLVIGLFDESYFIDFVSDPAQPVYTRGRRSVSLSEESLRLASDGWGTVRVPAVRLAVE